MGKVSPKIFSFGGGVQSMAALVLAAQGTVDYHLFLFANTGDDSENPETLAYVRTIAVPYARQHGLQLTEMQRPGETLYQHITRPGNTFAGIPMRLSSGKPARRACTSEYKVEVVDRWLRHHTGVQQLLDEERVQIRQVMAHARRSGKRVTFQQAKEVLLLSGQITRPLATVGLGISCDEIHRARTNHPFHWKRLDYPLLTLKLTRKECVAIILKAGLPIPPKSACWFCPFKTLPLWRDLQGKRPDLFEKAAQFEDEFNRGRRFPMWLTRTRQPLREAVQQRDGREHTWDICESGHCWT